MHLVYLYTVVDTSSYFGIHSSHLFWSTQFRISLPILRLLLLLLTFPCASPLPPPASFHLRLKSRPKLSVARGVASSLPVRARPGWGKRLSTTASRVPCGSVRPVLSPHTRITCTYSASGAHPHHPPVFLTVVHRTVTYYSHVCSGIPYVRIIIHKVFVLFSFETVPFRFSPIPILDIVPIFLLFVFYCTALVTAIDNGNVRDVYSVYLLPSVD